MPNFRNLIVLIGAGLLLVGLAFWTQFPGEVLLSQRIEPARESLGTVFTARTIDLVAGEYGLTLDIDDVHP